MITYHPFGSRGYKNLQIWNMNTDPNNQFQVTETHIGQVLMNDQEPVYLNLITDWKKEHQVCPEFHPDISMRIDHTQYQSRNINDVESYYQDRLDGISYVARMIFTGMRTPCIVHSELRSPAIKSLTKEFVSVYVFWHGLIARDWYRHWKHNQQCMPSMNRVNNKKFLLYARDFTGSRKYREHFVKQLITNHLASAFRYQNYPDEACLRQHFPPQDKLKHYTSKDFVAEVIDQQTVIPDNRINVPVTDQSSAFINTDDYNSTAIQIVAETIFEDQRIHLTEKTFQPMVAGQPFITLSSPGTLEILKYYGFQTFDHAWDESYDQIKDPAERMSAVIDVIKYLNTHDKFEELYEKCMPVCEHNRNHFFSNQFESQILSEYDHNWRSAIDQQNEIAKFDPGGSMFWSMNENLTKLNFELTDFELKYLQYQLQNIKNFSVSQYEGILKQYDWTKKLIQPH